MFARPDCFFERELVGVGTVPRILSKTANEMELTTRTIQSITEDVVASVLSVTRPERIVLFGSWARGDAGPDSDVDVLVVTPFEGARHVVALALLKELADLPVPKDVIVLSPEEWERKKDLPGTVAYPAAREGVVLYER